MKNIIAAPNIEKKIAGILCEEAIVGAHGWKPSYITRSGFKVFRTSIKMGLVVMTEYFRPP